MSPRSSDSTVYVHLLALDGYLLDADKLAHLVLLDDLLIEDGRRALGELVVLSLLRPLVGLDVVAQQRRLLLGDDGDVDVGAGAEVVEDTGEDGVARELDGALAGQVGLPLRLEDAHGGEAAGAHGDVGELVGATMGVDGEEVDARRVAAGDDEVGADVALVLEEVLLEEGHGGDDAGLAAGGQGVELQLGRDEGRGELRVRGGAGARAPDLGGDEVKLLAVLVGDDGAGRCSSIGGDLVGWERKEVSPRSHFLIGKEVEERRVGGKERGIHTTTPPS